MSRKEPWAWRATLANSGVPLGEDGLDLRRHHLEELVAVDFVVALAVELADLRRGGRFCLRASQTPPRSNARQSHAATPAARALASAERENSLVRTEDEGKRTMSLSCCLVRDSPSERITLSRSFTSKNCFRSMSNSCGRIAGETSKSGEKARPRSFSLSLSLSLSLSHSRSGRCIL